MVFFGPETIKTVLSDDVIRVQDCIQHRRRQLARQHSLIDLRRQRGAPIHRPLALMTRLMTSLTSELSRRDCLLRQLIEIDDSERRKSPPGSAEKLAYPKTKRTRVATATGTFPVRRVSSNGATAR